MHGPVRAAIGGLILMALHVGCGPSPGPFEARYLVVDARAAPDHAVRTVSADGNRTRSLFDAPPFSRIHQAVMTPDGGQLVMAYTPPPRDGTGFFDHSAIYRLDLVDQRAGEGVEPVRWFGQSTAGVFLLEPALAPDGSSVFFVRVEKFSLAGPSLEKITLERYDVATAAISQLLPNAIWPRVSPDGALLTFIGLNPVTRERGLFVSATDGSALRELVPIGRYLDIDTPVFSRDGRWVYFTIASEGAQSSLFQWQGLIGTAHAHADHNTPSQWWRVAVDGGRPEALGSERAIILHGDRSPDDEQLLYSTREGVFVQQLPHGDRQRVLAKGEYATVQWLP